MNLIEIIDITKSYGKGGEPLRAVDGLSLQIKMGEFISVMGSSGSGKSTLLSVLGGLNEPTSGRVRIDEIDIYALSRERLADFRKEYIGFVFQAFHLLPYLTVVENVMVPLAISEYRNGQKKERAMSVLEAVGLAGKAARLPDELSGGEQERVAIARALVNDPPIILADEPTGNLDSKTGREVMNLFKSLNEQGRTILMVTHDEKNKEYASRCLYMQDGRLVN